MFSNMAYIYEVYKERSFSKAAKNLYISQPALSAAIKKVENKIGMPIFERSINPIRLTECGEKYIKTIEGIMDLQNDFTSQIENLGNLFTGKIVVGGSSMFASFLLPSMVVDFKKMYPNVKISLVEEHTSVLEKRLLDGSIDIVIDNLVFSKLIYNKIDFIEEHLLLAVPKSISDELNLHSYFSAEDIKNNLHCDAKGIDISLFKNYPFVYLRSHNDTRERAEKICFEANFTPQVTLKLDQQISSYHITDFGVGISFISDTLIKKIAPTDKIAFFKIDSSHAKRSVHFHYKRNKYCTNAMKAFFSIAEKHK